MALQFAGTLSPWWLLVVLPLAVIAGLWLYRGQWKDVPRWQAAGIMILRCALLAGLVFIAFRPNLLLRHILTFTGRVVLLLDDSESMMASDSGLTEAEALRWARSVERGGQNPPCHELARTLAGAVEQVRRFQVFAQGADRTGDRFWREAERASKAVSERFDAFGKLAGTVTGLGAEERRKFDEITAQLPAFRSGAQDFFSGNRNPAARVYDAYTGRLEESRKALFEIQAVLDRVALEDKASPLHAQVEAMRRQTRLALLAHTLEPLQALPSLQAGPGVQTAYECVQLMTGGRRMLKDLAPASLAAAPGPTDILGAIDRLVREENPFPLAGLVLFSDGRHLAGGSAEITARLAAQKQAPIHVAALGAVKEPYDLAVLDVVAPPFAVKGSPATLRVRLKTILPAPADIRVELFSGGQVVAGETVRAGEAAEVSCVLRVVPPETGRFRYTVKIAGLDAERLPARNNQRDIVMNVRNEKVRVLLLDGRPRWETRFVLNILQRLDYIDLNAIIVATQPDAKLTRGVKKGTWPRDRATLGLYDLILLGDLPAELLTAGEWAAVREAVERNGRTLAFLGNGTGAARPPDPAVADALWPFAGGPATPTSRAADALDGLCVTETGRLHPLTAALGEALPVAPEERVPRLRPDTQALALSAAGGTPVIGVRRAGSGKVLLLDEDRLWKRLNPTMLTAHAAMVLNLVSWAVDGDAGTDGTGRPVALPVLDQHVLDTREALQVWLADGSTNTMVEAVAGGQVVQSQPSTRTRPEAALSRAVFHGLPATDIRFRIRDRGELSGPLFAVESLPELGFVGRNDALLSVLAAESGGRLAEFTDAGGLLPQIPPKERVEKQERVWRLWDAKAVFVFLLLMLTAEWVWRKWVGLV